MAQADVRSLEEIVAQVLEVDANELDDDTSPDTLEAWNSLAAVQLVITLQETFDIEFTGAEIMAMRSLALIRRVLRKKGVTA